MTEYATRPRPDALALEYKRDYGTATGNLNITDIVNNPTSNGLCRVLCDGLSEERFDLPSGKVRAIFDHGTDSFLIAEQGVKTLA